MNSARTRARRWNHMSECVLAYKPGSVEAVPCSRTRTVISLGARSLVPSSSLPAVCWVGRPPPHTWPCSSWGLPSHTCYQVCGGLLLHLFTLASTPGRTCTELTGSGLFSVALSIMRARRMSRDYLAACPREPGLSSRAVLLEERPARPSGQRAPDNCKITGCNTGGRREYGCRGECPNRTCRVMPR